MPKLFGTAGIRGRTNVDITPELVLRMSKLFVLRLGDKPAVALGRDTRYGAEMLAQAAAAGAASAGARVLDCGILPTGGLATYITKKGCAGGILLTGSHTPPDRIGLCLLERDGAYLSDSVAEELEKAFFADRPAGGVSEPASIGSYAEVKDALELYRDDLLGRVDAAAIRERRFRVLIDPANGTACRILPEVLSSLWCQIESINDQPAPVPGRPSEPRASSTQEAATATRKLGCDFGVALDVDADRVLFIDSGGNPVSEDVTGALFAERVLARAPKKVCVTPINSSGLIEWLCAKIGVWVEFCRAGQPATVERIKQLGASYSYEESGKYYFAEECLWCDGLLAIVKMLEILVKEEKSLSALAGAYPKFYQLKHTLPWDPAKSHEGMEVIRSIWEKEGLENRKVDLTIDGLKRSYNDHSWLLLRPSGTEPLIRIYSDAMSPERAEALVAWGESVVKRSLAQLGPPMEAQSEKHKA